MTYQERVMALTRSACDNLIKSIRAMPEDKLDWKVLDTGRSALDQLQEVAQSIDFAIPILVERRVSDFDPEKYSAAVAMRKSWSTIDECEKALHTNLGKYEIAVLSFPDENLEDSLWLPFGEGFETTYFEIMMFAYWNAVYHLGQTNFIQTLYGDWEMR